MFRFFRRENLRSTRRRSASCPNLESASVEDEMPEKNYQNGKAFKSSSESDSSEDDCTSKFERLKARQSVRRFHMKEKEKKENSEKNLISMDDYFGKLSELKTWLKEERKKDVASMRSPKLKAHFKTFVKLWNKRKLPLKYYRSCSVDLDNGDKPSCSNIVQQPVNPPYSLAGGSAQYSTTILPPPFDLSSEDVLNDIGSPFSTFGKSGDLLTSPSVLAEQVSFAPPLLKQKGGSTKESSPRKYHLDRSSPSGSPPKFATIYRSIPATSLYKLTAQPWTSGENVKVCPVSASKSSDTHTGEHMYKSETEQQKSSLTKSPGPSPVYSSVIDAIPYSTGSPKYAEIDESICSPLHRLPSSGYCSLSPLQEWRAPNTDVKQGVFKRQSLNRRRSKSVDDLYSVPFKAGHFGNVKHILDKDDIEVSKSPPVPERKYSPIALFSTSDQKSPKASILKDFDGKSKYRTSPSKATLSPFSSPENGPTKRRSQEGEESDSHNTDSSKKAKSTWSSNTDIQNKSNEMSSTDEDKNASTPKFSILTGSLNPTTRSRYKFCESMDSSETRSTVETKDSEPRLSILEIRQMEESPKLSRRRMKRRSSSLSTTPGKGLTFGKASKMSAASPKRVSFAKSVKQTENKATPGKSLKHRCLTPIFTRQTQDRKEFESFLSSHESPPKVPSPDKSSSLKTSSPSRRISPQKYLNNNVTAAYKVNNESQDNISRKCIIASSDTGDKSDYSQLDTSSISETIIEDRIFPSSSTRQPGRRVIGPPKPSPSKNCDCNTQVTPKKNLGSTSRVVSPEKNQLTACQVSSPEKNSGNAFHIFSSHTNPVVPSQLISPRKHQEKTLYLTSPHKNLRAASPLVSPQKNLRAVSHLVSPQKNQSAASQLVCAQENKGYTSHLASPQNNMRIATQSQSSQKHQWEISPQQHLRSPQKSNFHLKDLNIQTKLHSATKKLFDLPSSLSTSRKSIHSLVSKLTEKTTTICAKELSESDDCLSSDEVLSLAPISNTSEALETRPGTFANLADLHLESQELDKGNGDFEVAVLESSPRSTTNETVDCAPRSSVTSSAEVQSAKNLDSGLYHTIKTSSSVPVDKGEIGSPPNVSHLSVDESSLQTLKEINNLQSVQKILHISKALPIKKMNSTVIDKKKMNSEFELKNKHLLRKEATEMMQCFPLPVIDLAAEYQKVYNQKDDCAQPKEISSQDKVLCTPDVVINNDSNAERFNTDTQTSIALTKEILTSDKAIMLKVDGPNDSALKLTSKQSSADFYENISSASTAKKEGYCDLKRLASIRASPKIVENDGWITERRRSSRGKSSHSFRQAYNWYMLKSSSKDEVGAGQLSKEEDKVGVGQLSKEENLNLTDSFIDGGTGENILLKTSGNILDTLSQNSNEILDKEKYEFCYETDQTCAAATEKKTVAKPVKPKPPTLPKPSKPALLVNRKHNAANNFIGSTSKVAQKQRSSLARKEGTITASNGQEKSGRMSKENSTVSSRVSMGKYKSGEVLSNEKESSKQVSRGKYKSSTRKSNGQDKCLESVEQKSEEKDLNVPIQDYKQKNISGVYKDSNKPSCSSQGWSVSQKSRQTTRKRSSSGAGDRSGGRRQSNGKSVNEENKIPTFAERRNFFRQLNKNTCSSVKKPSNETYGAICHGKYSPQKQNQQI